MKVYGQLEAAQLEQLSSAPTSRRGRLYFDTTLGKARYYDGSNWVDVLGRAITGSVASATAVTTAGITVLGAGWEIIFIKGNAAPIDITANPQVSVGAKVGDRLTLIGTDSTNYVDFEDGTGLLLNGAWRALNGSVLDLLWNGSVWLEIGRNDL